MSKVRAIFLGTPEFSAKILAGLLNDEHFEIVGVVSQPDKPRGRDLKLLPSATKALATQNRIPVITPIKINTPEFLNHISEWKAEIAIVVAYGQLLSNEFLNLFHFGAVNIHGSLLPKWRGAAPIQRSIEAGETETGVSLQKIVKELDAGDIIGTRNLTVSEEQSALDVLESMIPLSLDLLKIDLMDFIRGNLAPRPQDHSQATFAGKILKSETQINWNLDHITIHNKVRAYIMGPGAWTVSKLGRLKILKTRTLIDPSLKLASGELAWKNNQLIVGTGANGLIELVEVQPESRKRQTGKDWWHTLNGQGITHLQFQQPELHT
jgi:methionyl-tRNA formyltransferase